MPNNSASQSSLREESIFAPSGFALSSIVRDTKLCTITSFDEYVKRLALNI